MTYGADRRLELLERGLCEVATILAGMARDRATFDRLERITSRYHLPDEGELAPWEQPSVDAEDEPHDDLSGPARPA